MFIDNLLPIKLYLEVMKLKKEHKEKYIQLGLSIAYHRKKRGLTQEGLAEMINVSRTHISNIEATKVDKSVSLDVLFDISDALEVNPGMLFDIRF